jgi:hypothetical protein
MNMNNARAAGLLVGAYHIAYPYRNSQYDEATNFLEAAAAYIGNSFLPPVLDLENDYVQSYPNLSLWVSSWINYVEQQTCVTPIIYAGKDVLSYLENESPGFTRIYKLWIADYDTPWDPLGTPSDSTLTWQNWRFKQYATDSTTYPSGPPGACPGISGQVDLNSFQGGLSDLIALTHPAPTPLFGGLGGGPITPPLDGSFVLEINLPGASQIVVQASEDLITWTDVARLSRTGCKFVYVDIEASSHTKRYYRVKP